jgi:WGR domain
MGSRLSIPGHDIGRHPLVSNEWRFYRLEIWSDLFGRALLVRQWGRIGTEAIAGSIRIPIMAPRSTR